MLGDAGRFSGGIQNIKGHGSLMVASSFSIPKQSQFALSASSAVQISNLEWPGNLCVSNRKWCGLLGKPTSHICTIYTCSSLCSLTCFMCPNCVPRSKKNCWNLGIFCPFLHSSSVIWGRLGPWLACHAIVALLVTSATSRLLMFRVAKEPFALLDLVYRDGMDSHVT